MIPEDFIESWRQYVPWQTLAMIEQDLVIGRALVCLYSNPTVRESLVFRGGTALNKIYLHPPARYSEDIDFVQRRPEPIGETLNAIRHVLDNWLGEPKRKLTERSAKLIYQYKSINKLPAKLKIEINTTEHFQVLDLHSTPYTIKSEWFEGRCVISTYQLEELMATKLRALYQRRKGRDLFDLWHVFTRNLADPNLTIEIFRKYCENDGNSIKRDAFYKNMELKRTNNDFQFDMEVLLPHSIQWDFHKAFEYVQSAIISRIPN